MSSVGGNYRLLELAFMLCLMNEPVYHTKDETLFSIAVEPFHMFNHVFKKNENMHKLLNFNFSGKHFRPLNI